jgi:hypothetical protein
MVRRRPSRSIRRALDDLSEGLQSLLGVGDSCPELVDELLEGRRRTPPRTTPSSAKRSGARRPRASAKRHLVLVK